MEISSETRGAIDILRVHGSIRADNNAEFARALGRLKRTRRFRLILDASDLEFVNSRAIGDLVGFARVATVKGGKMVFVRPGRALSKILDSVGLLSLVPSHETLEEAVAACGGES